MGLDIGLNTDAAVTDPTLSASEIALLKGILTNLGGAAGVLRTSGGIASVIVADRARPADTTAYAALDCVSDSTTAPTVITFANVARLVGGNGYIIKAQLETNQKTCVARFRLHLFSVAPTAINDNSPYLKLDVNRAVRVGQIDFPACATEDPTNSTAAGALVVPGSGNLPLSFVCGADANLYGLLETLDIFTPASGQKFTIKLGVDQN